ncbi:malate dehydrogenase (quinone) [Salinibius halmophilus]|uniref:malate dehydrogenase (quinone) n=1 Tax=Salinibius halmophilus TaxID=1853216 RepID=UPI000E66D66A|nr:malate dehydrogenase (quinone) [Salinibius halmophilus]
MTTEKVDVLLVGAGVMSTTLAMLLKSLDQSLSIAIVEALDAEAKESTDGLNNAGTGHAAYCELNYTPKQADGSINTSKAFTINEQFEVSLQFWSYLVKAGVISNPDDFIRATPHMSFVWGEDNVAFLKKRHELLSAHHFFSDMQYSEDRATLNEWMPLVMSGRDANTPVAATRVPYGSDVDFGALTRLMMAHLKENGLSLHTRHKVANLRQANDGRWQVSCKSEETGAIKQFDAGFVFLGAGGASLQLLQKSGIKESVGYGGFPVSGQWLICRKPEIVEQHHAKVYGKAPIGAPPMSVPHLDTRVIEGKKALLFGPYAGFTTKFLKQGSLLDLPFSVKPNNLTSMLTAGLSNVPLTKYLISEVMQSHESRVEALRNFYPDVKAEDWELGVAGQRVQIIKRDPSTGKGKLEFGTEVITSSDGSLACLLGASPGASTSVNTMVGIVETCFPERVASEWQAKLKEMFPSYGEKLVDNAELAKTVRDQVLQVLKLV